MSCPQLNHIYTVPLGVLNIKECLDLEISLDINPTCKDVAGMVVTLSFCTLVISLMFKADRSRIL